MFDYRLKHINEEELFMLIKEDNMEAFDEMFRRLYPLLCAYANQFVGLDDSQDIVQDTMVWLWQNRNLEIIKTSIKNYLFKIIKNRCITLINHNEMKQRVVTSLFHDENGIYDFPNFFIIEEIINNIEKALDDLPENYRQAFLMNRFQNMTYKEIAEKLEVSPKTIDYRIQQALKILRVKLKDYLPLLTLIFYNIKSSKS